jgi:hypothetical protein
MSKIGLPLEQVSVASPCTASWDAMTGDGRVRHCGQCDRHVYNLSEMRREDAEALVQSVEGRMCIRFYRRADGTLLTDDCPVGLQAVRRQFKIAVGVAAATIVLMFGTVLAALGLTRVSDPNSRRLRDIEIEPFHTVMEWLSPSRLPATAIEMGEMACPVPAAPPPQPAQPPEPEEALPARRS